MELVRPITDYPWARIRVVAAVAFVVVPGVWLWPGWSGSVTPAALMDWCVIVGVALSYLWILSKMLRSVSMIDVFFYVAVVMPAIGFASRHAVDAFRSDPASLLRSYEFRFGCVMGAVALAMTLLERRFPALVPSDRATR